MSDKVTISTEEYNRLLNGWTETETLKSAVKALCDKVEECGKASEGIFTVARIHGVHYTGPNWNVELGRARALLPTAGKE